MPRRPNVSKVTNLTILEKHYDSGRDYTVITALKERIVATKRSGVSIMKLPLIAASVVTYTVLALAWIVYAGLTPASMLF